jgi:hypothetical protein
MPVKAECHQDYLLATGLFDHLMSVDAPVATREQLQRVHLAEYLDALESIVPQRGIVHLDPDTAEGRMSLLITHEGRPNLSGDRLDSPIEERANAFSTMVAYHRRQPAHPPPGGRLVPELGWHRLAARSDLHWQSRKARSTDA